MGLRLWIHLVRSNATPCSAKSSFLCQKRGARESELQKKRGKFCVMSAHECNQCYVEHRMSHPCLFCLNKASCHFLNENIQNSTAALAWSLKQKTCDAFSRPLSHHWSTSANGNLHPMFKTQQAQRQKNEKNLITQ
jgi:hypothetical protein